MAVRVDQLTYNQKVVNEDGTFTPSFIANWNNLLRLVQTVATIDGNAITTTAPITGGGSVGGTLAPISLADSGVTPATYGSASNIPQFTVDAKGRLTSAANVPVSAGAAWTVRATQALSGANTYNFTDLTDSEYLVVLSDVTKPIATQTILRVSVDNGSSYFSTSGDYATVDTNGALTNGTGVFFDSATATARSGFAYIIGGGVSGPIKPIYANRANYFFLASTSPINALRLTTASGANWSGGTAYVLGR